VFSPFSGLLDEVVHCHLCPKIFKSQIFLDKHHQKSHQKVSEKGPTKGRKQSESESQKDRQKFESKDERRKSTEFGSLSFTSIQESDDFDSNKNSNKSSNKNVRPKKVKSKEGSKGQPNQKSLPENGKPDQLSNKSQKGHKSFNENIDKSVSNKNSDKNSNKSSNSGKRGRSFEENPSSSPGTKNIETRRAGLDS
jgi:hypothetical protein